MAEHPERREGMMRPRHTIEIVFLLLVIIVSLAGFSSLVLGERVAINGYHVMHIVASLVWLSLLLAQLLLIRQRRFDRHRLLGKSIMVVGPILVASVALLTVHSAAREAAEGTVDDLVVQNVAFTLEVALLVWLAFVLRHKRNVHGALLMSSALMFLVIALFFTFISYVPGYRIEGPETFDRFAKSGQTAALIGAVIGLLFFLKNVRTGWPWLLVSVFLLLDGYVQMVVAKRGHTMALTVLVGSIGEVQGFFAALIIFTGLLWLAWKVNPTRGARNAERVAAIITMLATLGACGDGARTTAGAPGDVQVTVRTGAITAPDTVSPGWRRVSVNETEGEHIVVMFRLPATTTADEVTAFVAALDTSPATPSPGVAIGGPEVGKQGEVIVHVTPGVYVLACVRRGEDKHRHASTGEVAVWHVRSATAADSVHAAPPPSTQTLRLVDFAYVGPDHWAPGKQLVRIENTGKQDHQLRLARLRDGATLDAWMKADDPNTVATTIVGIARVGANEVAYLPVDLTPGTYIAYCLVADPTSKQAHVELGMMRVIQVP